MTVKLRPLMICLVAYVASLAITLLAFSTAIDLGTATLATSVPMRAMLMPMIAVVGFWGICRVFGVALAPARTFLIGAIVIYGLLFFMGRVVAMTQVNESLATITAMLALFVGCYVTVSQASDVASRDL